MPCATPRGSNPTRIRTMLCARRIHGLWHTFGTFVHRDWVSDPLIFYPSSLVLQKALRWSVPWFKENRVNVPFSFSLINSVKLNIQEGSDWPKATQPESFNDSMAQEDHFRWRSMETNIRQGYNMKPICQHVIFFEKAWYNTNGGHA